MLGSRDTVWTRYSQVFTDLIGKKTVKQLQRSKIKTMMEKYSLMGDLSWSETFSTILFFPWLSPGNWDGERVTERCDSGHTDTESANGLLLRLLILASCMLQNTTSLKKIVFLKYLLFLFICLALSCLSCGTWSLQSLLQHSVSFSCSMWDLLPQPRIELRPPALGAESLRPPGKSPEHHF